MKELNPAKFTYHKETALPIRLSPAIRNRIRQSPQDEAVVLGLIQKWKVLGQRDERDLLTNNFEQNVRYRKVAREVSKVLTEFARNRGYERFCTVVHGSIARGLVRHPDSQDPSDIDVDLVVGEPFRVQESDRIRLRAKLHNLRSDFGIGVDSYLYDFRHIRNNSGFEARQYLACSGYPLADTGGVWENIIDLGISAAQYLRCNKREKRFVKRLLEAVMQGEIKLIQLGGNYLGRLGLNNCSSPEEKAGDLYRMLQLG